MGTGDHSAWGGGGGGGVTLRWNSISPGGGVAIFLVK